MQETWRLNQEYYSMVKEFTYHGLSKEELSNIPNEKLLKLFTARIRRSLTRGTMSDDKKN